MVQSFVIEMTEREATSQLIDNEFVKVVSHGLVVTVTFKRGSRVPEVIDLELVSGSDEVELRVENHILRLKPIRSPRRGINAVWL